MRPGELERIRKDNGRAAVVGLGVSGMAALRLLARLGFSLSACDERGREEFDPAALAWLERHRVRTGFGRVDEELLSGSGLVVLSPGVDQRRGVFRRLAARGARITGELAMAASLAGEPMVAVTGSNGKSTVVRLLAELFAAAGMSVFAGGNYGTPLSEYLCGPSRRDRLVLEVSSFQLDTARFFRPQVGVLLNITPDHLDRYRGFEEYAAAKLAMFAQQGPDDIAVLNLDDPRAHAAPGAGRRFWFGRDRGGDEPGVFVRGDGLVVRGMGGEEERLLPVDNPALAGGVNMLNAAAAMCAALAAGCGPEAAAGFAAFTPLPHRLETVAEINGVRYVDDSKATNIGATAAALAAVPGPVVLIAGGREKGADYAPLLPLVRERVRAVLVIGEARENMARAFAGASAVEACADMDEAVARARGLARPGDTVLLSPACASFDMFPGYARRGEVFRRAVLAGDRKEEAAAGG